mmetsp:Transcript_28438/g.50384  ORF Transcript_28438/g.50384 Transcript_28438/m.50384 type:complete len:369 (-) Transcript_28438:672-1778(-)
MMNCIPQSSPFRRRFSPRIIDVKDDDDEIEEYLRSHPCDMEASKAEEVEKNLSNALSMAERSNGSLLCFQQMSKNRAIDMGRQISSIRSMEELPPPDCENGDLGQFTELAPSSSFRSVSSLPTFLKVEKSDAALAILNQRSWDTADSTESEGDSDASPGKQNPPKQTVRSWNKLRKAVDQEEKAAKQSGSSPRFTGLGASIRKMRLSRSKVVPDEMEGGRSFAKNAPVEVSLPPKKKRGWGRLRRGNKAELRSQTAVESEDKISRGLPVEPVQDVLDTSVEEEEDFFVNDNVTVEQTSVSEVDDPVSETMDDDVADISVEEAQSMEIICGLDGSSNVDIIGATFFLKGVETSWNDLTEDSFDIVPRRK